MPSHTDQLRLIGQLRLIDATPPPCGTSREMVKRSDVPAHARDLAAFPTGVVVIGDKSFAGREFERDMTELGITFVRPYRRDEKRRHGNLSMIRQRIESIINTTPTTTPPGTTRRTHPSSAH